MKGIIKKLDERGFGFIKLGEGQKDIFFHANDCTAGNFKSMKEGMEVSFETAQSDKGPKAVNVMVVEAGGEDAPEAEDASEADETEMA